MAAPLTAESLDKSAWPVGPWRAEADLVAVTDAPTGYSVLLNRDPTGGHWLAYVGVPAGHVAYGVADVLRLPVGAMGGLSYAGPLAGGDASRWWLGFSCGAAGALQPLVGTGSVYVTQDAALALAVQLARDLYRFGGSVALGVLGLGPLPIATPVPSATNSATTTAASIGATASGATAGVTVAVPPVASVLTKP